MTDGAGRPSRRASTSDMRLSATRLAYLLTGDRQLAEDLVQDASVKLAGRLVHLRDPGAFDAYLRRTVVNLANSHFRRKRVERTYLSRTAAEPPVFGEAPDTGRRDELWKGLQRLPTRQRTAIVLRVYEDLPEDEWPTSSVAGRERCDPSCPEASRSCVSM